MSESNYNKDFKVLARNLRKNGTKGEAKLWSEILSNKKFYGLRFNMQFPIGNYIVDFICRQIKLIVEIDGASHQHITREDELRDQQLNMLGYRVVRVSEREVLSDMSTVIRTIEAYLPPEILVDQSP